MNKLKALASAEKYVLKGKIPAAIDRYRKAIEYDPADTTTINTLGDLYVRVGQIGAAIENFSFLAERYFQSGFIQKAIAMLKKIEKVDPQNLKVLKKLAAIYAGQGQAKEARERYLRLVELGERCGARDLILESYQEIVRMDPTDASAHAKIGELFAMQGMSCRATEAYRRAGEEFDRKKLWEPSLAAYTKVLSFEPQNIRALAAIARIYLHKEQPNRAIA
jgi:tetratricopeptide (TPR) repeat protein